MELYHHGIKGQKWGVRRYQYADGTYTPAGRKRYGVSQNASRMERMSYPCICYEQSKIQNAAADNRVYLQRIFYQLTVIDSRPDSKITKALMQMAKCHYGRPYKADNLYHDVITIYF